MLVHLDVSKGSENAGDHIITQAIAAHVLDGIGSSVIAVPTHHRPSLPEVGAIYRARTILAGGSNLLSSHMERHRQWLVTPDLALGMHRKVVLCGVGWWQYQTEPCYYTERLLRWMLNPEALHSVRDSYTASRLEALGYQVLNTGCPTMWETERTRANSSGVVVATLTDYLKDPSRDHEFLTLLSSTYERVRVVAMAEEDARYLSSLGLDGHVELAGVGLSVLDNELAAASEYVGTRLYAGIRALQVGVPAVVVAVDNRATEIGRDTGLPVVQRSSLSRQALDDARTQAADFVPSLDRSSIECWRAGLHAELGPS